MKDRSVEFPNRYRLTKVAGTDDIFDLVPAPGDVTEEGTYINKATLLKDTTAALYGLDEDAVPDDALNVLSRFQSGLGNEYVWEKMKSEYVATLTDSGRKGSFWNAGTLAIKFSSEIRIDGETITMVNPVALSTVCSNQTEAVAYAKGKYTDLGATGGTVYYVSDADWDGNYFNLYWNVVESKLSFTSCGYVNSPDPNAYPPSVDDGYTYTALGQLGEKLRIATGSYTGTGTYGARNPNSLTFDFEPKFVAIISNNTENYNMAQAFWVYGSPYVSMNGYGNSDDNGYSDATLAGNTLSWYNTTGANYQANASGKVFNYIAIG